jgi:hypothetical protein
MSLYQYDDVTPRVNHLNALLLSTSHCLGQSYALAGKSRCVVFPLSPPNDEHSNHPHSNHLQPLLLPRLTSMGSAIGTYVFACIFIQ